MRKMMRRVTATVLIAAALLLPVRALPETSARSAILIDADTGQVLYESNADTQSLIASTTKIMTALVVLEHLPPEREVEIPEEAVGIEGSSIYLRAGEHLTVEALLYGLLLHSGNDAAVALALVCAGSVEEFVDLMNLKAQKLGLKNTHFENPNGLDGENHHSSARDLAILTQSALENELFAKIVSTKTVQIGDRSLTNHNRLLWSCEGCIGIKTGYTKAAGRTLVSAARRNGRTLIAVTLNDANDWQDHCRLYDYGFSLYQNKTVVRAGQTVAEISLMNGSKAELIAGESFDYFCTENETVHFEVDYPKLAFSRGKPGGFAGYGGVYIGTKRVATVRLLWGKENEGENSENSVVARCGLSPCGGKNDR